MKRPGPVIVLFLGIVYAAATESHALEAILPSDLETQFVWRTDQLPDGVDPGEALFALDREGRPHLGFRDIVVALGHRDGLDHQAYRVTGVQTIDAFAWMRDGVLTVISGNELGVARQDGLDVMLTLPSRDMRIEPASGSRFYLYGGDTPAQQRSLYVYRKGGELYRIVTFRG